MSLRCKPGDLAVIVRADDPKEAGDVGKLVVVEDAGDTYWNDSRHFWTCRSQGGLLNVLEEDGSWSEDDKADIPDGNLQPIRDQPGADETLTWAGKPNEIIEGATT